jgi:meso-butanediol dehydrogenase/(S,S)-butanediol dehydrogenase/diacetyl reductase
MKLEGKVALVTGGGTGIGAAVAKRFVSEGAKVCITGRRREMLDKIAHSLPEGSVITCPGDVSRYEDIKLMVSTTMKFGGKLDVLVNNAASDDSGSVVDMKPENWRKMIEVNLTAPFLLMKEIIPHMIDIGGGSIINVASLAGLVCLPEKPGYCTTKAGLIHLTRQAALDYGRYNVRCNVVCPGATRTEMLENSLRPLTQVLDTDIDGAFKFFTSPVPLRKAATPDEMAGIFSYLASDDSSFMTAAVLVVDGGAQIVDVSGAAISSVMGG